jgi:hypothetical protein
MRLVVSNIGALRRTPAARAVASTTATPGRPDATSATTGMNVSKPIAGHTAESFAGGLPVRYDEHFIKWIPLVVPMFAVMLAVGAYFILGMVL